VGAFWWNAVLKGLPNPINFKKWQKIYAFGAKATA